jgi:hypothetical protein
MAENEVTGSFQASVDPLVARITLDPKVSKVEGRPYLVYELRESTSEPAEAPPAQLGVSSRMPVRFSLEDHGCYFAASPEEACKDAARFLGRLGQFVAVKATRVELDFAASRRPPDQAAAEGAS